MSRETKTLIKVYLALAVLTVSTAVISTIRLSWVNFVIAMAIAVLKASLVSLFFMHIHKSKVLVKIFAMGGLFWLLTLIGLTFNDYISRMWLVNWSIWMH